MTSIMSFWGICTLTMPAMSDCSRRRRSFSKLTKLGLLFGRLRGPLRPISRLTSMLRAGIGSPLPNAQKVIQLNGDLDLFGDGSIYIHRTVGHTPGSQVMVVRLPHTGTVVLTSDACYLK